MIKYYRHCIMHYNELGQIHREDGPAIQWHTGLYVGREEWYQNGNLHRIDGAAIICSNGDKYWYYCGKLINCKTQEEFERLIKLAILW